jgi:hypothetical protein
MPLSPEEDEHRLGALGAIEVVLRELLRPVPPSRELSLAITKLQEAQHWLRAIEP